METGRNNDDGISGRQLRELLRSLPAAHAPEDLELNLMYRIAENTEYPHRNRPRFPRARVRAESGGTTRTRGYDRLRGLAAAALAAFVVAGSWSLYAGRGTESPIDQQIQIGTSDGGSQRAGQSSSKENTRPGTLLNPAPTIVIERGVVVSSPENSSAIANGSASATPAIVAPEKTRQQESAPGRKETVPAEAISATPVVPPSIQTAPGTHAVDSLAHTTTPSTNPGGHDVGTGGEPPGDKEE